MDPTVPEAQIRAYNPDTVLTIKRNGGTKDPTGSYVVIQNYDVHLVDMKTNKTVWRATMSLYGSSGEIISSIVITSTERGQSLAMDMTNRMKSDGIFLSCPKYTTLKETPGALPGVLAAPSVSATAALPTLAAAATPAATATGTTATPTPAPVDPALVTTIDLPDGWKAEKLSDGLIAKRFTTYATNKSINASLLISSIRRSAVSDMQKYAQTLQNNQISLTTNGIPSDIETLNINNLPAWRFTLPGTSKSSGKNLTWLITVIENGNKISILTVQSATDHFSDNKEQLSKLAYLLH